MVEDVDEGLRRFCRECEVKGPHAVLSHFEDLEINTLQDLRKEEDEELYKSLRYNRDLQPGDAKKIMSGLKRLRKPINDKFIQFKDACGGPSTLKAQHTAVEADDAAAVDKPRRIIEEILQRHHLDYLDDMTVIDEEEVLECKRRLEACFKSWLEEQNSQFDFDQQVLSEQNARIYQNIQEFFCWLGVSEKGELKDFDFGCLSELDLRLKAYPTIRQCFHKLRVNDVSGIGPLLDKFPHLTNEVWLPEQRTLLCAAIAAQHVEAVKLLISKGALVDSPLAQDTKSTPLRVAVEVSGRSDRPENICQIVELLLQAGADVESFQSSDPNAWGSHGANSGVIQLIQKHWKEQFPSLSWEHAPIHYGPGPRVWEKVGAEASATLTAAFHKKIVAVDSPGLQANFNHGVVTYSDGDHKKSYLFRRSECGVAEGPVRWMIVENVPGERWNDMEPTLERLIRNVRDATRPWRLRVQGTNLNDLVRLLQDNKDGTWQVRVIKTGHETADTREHATPGSVYAFRRKDWGFEVFEFEVFGGSMKKSSSASWMPLWTAQGPLDLNAIDGLDEVEDDTHQAVFVQEEPELEGDDEDEEAFQIPGKRPQGSVEDARSKLRERLDEREGKIESKIRKLREEIHKLELERASQSQEHLTQLKALHGTVRRLEGEKAEEMIKVQEEQEQLAREYETQRKQLEDASREQEERRRQDHKMREDLLSLQEELATNDRHREKLQQIMLDQEHKQAAMEESNNKILRELRSLQEKAQRRELKMRECRLEVLDLPPHAESIGLMTLIVSNELLDRLGTVAEDKGGVEHAEFVQTGVVQGRLTVCGPEDVQILAKSVVENWGWLDWHCFSADKSIVANLEKAKEASIRRQRNAFWKGPFGRKLSKIPLLASLQTLHATAVQDQMLEKHGQILETCLEFVRTEAHKEMDSPNDKEHWKMTMKSCAQEVSKLYHHEANVLQTCAERFVEDKIKEFRDSKLSKPSAQSVRGRFETIAGQFEENVKRLLRDFMKTPSEQALWDMMKSFNAHWSVANLFLPIYEQSAAMIEDFRRADVLVVECETGSGKSTALPALLQAELRGKVCISQPRILPCKRTAQFVSAQVQGSCKVSYETADRACEIGSEIVYMTDGLLSARLIGPDAAAANPFDVICLDEVHERNKNLDLAIMALARMLKEGKASQSRIPKVVVMSATLDEKTLLPFRHSNLMLKKFEIRVPSPYKIRDSKTYVGVHYMQAVEEIFKKKEPEEQILCFVPGTADVEKACASFTSRMGGSCGAEALHANRDAEEMQAALQRGTVFFATNIAETSITVPRLAHVVDVGKQKVPSSTNHVFRLEESFSARSTLRQRRGRCGRVRDGTYYPTYRGTWELKTGISQSQAKRRGDEVTRDFALPELLTGDSTL
ncbi:ATP-dependent RNA helicase HrpA [Durusdinium trenchii]|uniref:ATP-dependent RNA helicase HrpA n=1 Tax=Durusdinium trenchii TaxID=1381693 RepID=A0ABP0LF05_9DINO